MKYIIFTNSGSVHLCHNMMISFRRFTEDPITTTHGTDNGGVWVVGQVFDENDKYNSQANIDLVKGYK